MMIMYIAVCCSYCACLRTCMYMYVKILTFLRGSEKLNKFRSTNCDYSDFHSITVRFNTHTTLFTVFMKCSSVIARGATLLVCFCVRVYTVDV